MSIEPAGRRELEVFEEEIRVAVSYERQLVVKALGVLALLAVIVVLRTLYFALPQTTDRRPQTAVKGMCRWQRAEEGCGTGRPWCPPSR